MVLSLVAAGQWRAVGSDDGRQLASAADGDVVTGRDGVDGGGLTDRNERVAFVVMVVDLDMATLNARSCRT